MATPSHPPAPLRYRAFICYSREDRAAAAALHRRLEGFRVPPNLAGTVGRAGAVPAVLAPIFRDREELAASADIGERLREALARSDFLVVLCSPAAAQSRWVDAEIAAFRALRPENRGRVLAVILAGEPASGDAATECFPPALRGAAEAGALEAALPLAADFRAGRDDRRDAGLRLIAALLGVEFDALRRREQERRLGRLRASLGAAVLLVAGFAALAGFAFAQREEALRAADIARAANLQAEKARIEAANEAATSRAISDFLQNDLLAQAAPDKQPDRDIKLKTVLDQAAKRIEGRFAVHPTVEAEIRATLGETYFSITDYAQARQQLEAAFQLYGRHHPPEELAVLRIRTALTAVYVLMADYKTGESFGDATLAIQRRVLGARHPLTLKTQSRMGGLYQRQGRLKAADTTFREVLAAQAEVLGAEHFDTITTQINLGATCNLASNPREAEKLLKLSLEQLRRTVGASHPTALKVAVNLAMLLVDEARLGEADGLLKETLVVAENVLGPLHETTLGAKLALAGVRKFQGRLAESEELWRMAAEGFSKIFDPNHPMVLGALQGLASTYNSLARWGEAVPLLRDVLERKIKKQGGEHPNTLVSSHNLANTLLQMGKFQEAEQLLAEIVEKRSRILGPDTRESLNSAQTHVTALMALERFAEAAGLSERLVERSEKSLGPDHVVSGKVRRNLGEIYLRQGRLDEAERVLSTLHEKNRVLTGSAAYFRYDCADCWGELLIKLARFSEAEIVLQESLNGRLKDNPDDLLVHHTRSLLGAAISGTGIERAASAERFLEEGFRGFAANWQKTSFPNRVLIREAGARLLEFHRRWNPAKVAAGEEEVRAVVGAADFSAAAPATASPSEKSR